MTKTKTVSGIENRKVVSRNQCLVARKQAQLIGGRAGAEDLVWCLPSVKDLRSGRPLDLVRNTPE